MIFGFLTFYWLTWSCKLLITSQHHSIGASACWPACHCTESAKSSGICQSNL